MSTDGQIQSVLELLQVVPRRQSPARCRSCRLSIHEQRVGIDVMHIADPPSGFARSTTKHQAGTSARTTKSREVQPGDSHRR